MPPEVFPTTAEHVIAATDAVLLKGTGCDDDFVSQFLDVPVEVARYALAMAIELGLVADNPATGFCPCSPFAIYLVTANDSQKASVLRLLLENYDPYKTFKARLDVLHSAPQAAEQVRLLYGMTRHREEIKDTFVNLGMYAQSLISEGAGRFRLASFDMRQADFLQVVAEIAAERSVAEITIRRLLDDEVCRWIDPEEIFAPLVTAYQRLGQHGDTRSPIVYAGNAIESFLTQLGSHHNVDLSRATDINSKVDRFGRDLLSPKHKSMIMYLGHIRNAADHGIDPDIGTTWQISEETTIEYVHVALSAVKSIVLALLSNRYIL